MSEPRAPSPPTLVRRCAMSARRSGVALRGAAERFVIGLIRLYQLTLSPYVGRQCRFYPTCSQFAVEAIEAHGLLHGMYLSVRRLGRCHPFHPGGVDPVPAAADTGRPPEAAVHAGHKEQ